jgi:hypothetical protein
MKHFKPLLLFTLFFIMHISSIFGQTIVCYADLQFSLQMNKSIKMLPSDFIEINNVVDNDYTLEIKDADENIIPNNIIQFSSSAEVYTATVTNKETLNTCWTNFTVNPHSGANAIARCKQNLNVSLNPFGKYYITPNQVDNSSTGYHTLEINRHELTCDDMGATQLVKLSATGTDNVINQCICEVQVQDNLTPFVVMESNFSIILNSLDPYILTPEQVGLYGDNCEIQSLQVIPNEITCNSPNPTTVRLIVTDMGGNVVSATTQVSYTTTNVNMNGVIVCNDQITVEVNPTASITITPQMVLEGNYSCNSIFHVKLSYNGVEYPLPQVDWDDAGKIITYEVTDEISGNTCWGYLNVEPIEGCDLPFVVCDTLCPNGDPSNCASGYTNEDNIDWPCGFDIYVCDVVSAYQLSPEELETLHSVPSENVRPQIIDFDCSVLFIAYSDQVFSLGSPTSQNKKILRTWSVLNWLDGNLYEYTQIFNVYTNGLEICDTLPWNTPFGDCASGHTNTDAIEWPADITVNNALISLNGLRTNPDVHPNDVEPTLVEDCTSAYEVTYYDVVTTIDDDTKLIQRTWNVHNWVSSVTRTFVQNITVNYDNVNQVCAFTYYGEPINNVNMGLANTNESGCTTFDFIENYNIRPSKTGNARDNVDIMDLVMVYEGVLSIRELNPYQMIAADINGVNGVSTLDMYYIKQLIDGEINNWPGNTPVWKFIDKNHQIVNGLVTPYRDFINTNNLIYNNEFIGIKMGDVNGSYSADIGNNAPVFTVLKADDIALNKGETYLTAFSSDRNQSLVAVKLDFNIKDKGISVLDVESDVLPGFDKAKNVIITEDNISISWAIDLDVTPQGVSLRNNEDFLKFTYISNKNSIISDVLDLNLEVTNQIKQSGDVDPANVNLFWDLKIINGISDAAVSRLSITPNPFTNSINVLGLNDDARFEVLNSAGISINSGNMPVDGQLMLTNLENGLYFLRIFEKGKKPSMHKLIKME